MISISTAIMLCLFFAASATAAKKSSVPEFAANGKISGTEMMYENLAVNSNGIAVVTLFNPSGTSTSFRATFSFLDAKGGFLGSFTISGFAHKNSRVTYVDDTIDYSKIRRARSVKVLGRSGRVIDN